MSPGTTATSTPHGRMCCWPRPMPPASGCRGPTCCRRLPPSPSRSAARSPGLAIHGHPASFIIPVNATGVTTLCRQIAARDDNPFVSPISSRYDELDGQMWLDDVFVPWERVFYVDTAPEAIPRWLRWHHLYNWLSKAEFTLGLALALTHAIGLKEHEQTIEYLIDLIVEVQTVRSCLTAAEREPDLTPAGYCVPSHAHLAAGGIALFKSRQRISEILRIVPGSSLVVAPSDRDLGAPEMAAGL